MNEEFVPFKIAKKLKEKGFDEECLAYYTSENTLHLNKVVLCDDKYLEVAEIDYEECLRSYNTKKDRLLRTIVDAPTISQVLKWLRKEKKIHIMIDIWKVDFNDTTYKWGYDIVDLTTTHVLGCDTQCADSYEQAGVAGIEYCVDNII